jgi:hypothetical protein
MRRSIRVLVICCAVLLACLPVFAEEQSKPDSWRGIPLMPGYHSEEEAGLGYLTVVNVPFERAEQWYRDRMKADGWTVTVRTRSSQSLIGGGPMVSLDCKRGDDEVNVMLIYAVRENYTMAMHTPISR